MYHIRLNIPTTCVSKGKYLYKLCTETWENISQKPLSKDFHHVYWYLVSVESVCNNIKCFILKQICQPTTEWLHPVYFLSSPRSIWVLSCNLFSIPLLCHRSMLQMWHYCLKLCDVIVFELLLAFFFLTRLCNKIIIINFLLLNLSEKKPQMTW